MTGGGLPRGAITEIVGSMSSGRTSVLVASLAWATTNSETCVVVDTSDSFDPQSATNAGVDFNRLLWVRCGNNLERAFKATDLLLQSGGFGFIALNLAGVAVQYARRIISSWWFRFRQAIENTPTVLLVISSVACVRSCAAVVLEARNVNTIWPASISAFHTHLHINEQLVVRPRISLVDPRPQHNPSELTHTRLLTEIEVQIKLVKPNLWNESRLRFQHL